MKKTILIASVLLMMIVSFHLTSCAGETNSLDQKAPQKEIPEGEKGIIGESTFEQGTWKIDSVAEDQVVFDRLMNDSTIQVFNFRKNGDFSTMEVTPKLIKDRLVGTWKAVNDSFFVMGESGKAVMRYGFEIDDSVLKLNANFEVSSQNKKKPTFYLSKYRTYDESIYGPKK